MSPRGRRLALGVVVLICVQALALAIYFLVQSKRSTARTPFAFEPMSPRPAPELAFERSDGVSSSLAALRGKLVLVHFWGTWCEPCREELPSLVTTSSEYAERGVSLLAVAIEDDWDAIRRFLSGAVTDSFVRPSEPAIHRLFGASTLPDTYLIDRTGNVVARYAGARDWSSTAAREHLDSMLR